jgi:hypothetical protein
VLEKPETQGIQLGPSTEARRLKEALESRQPSVDGVGDADDIDDLDLDLENLIGSRPDADFEDVDMEEFDQLPSQVDMEGRETDKDLLAGEDESQVLGEAEKEEKLTLKTAKTPRKRRNLLTSYLNNKIQ